MAAGLAFSLYALFRAYTYQNELLLSVEDYQDRVFFEHVKKMGSQSPQGKAEDYQRMSSAQFWDHMRVSPLSGSHPDAQCLLTFLYK